MKKIKDDKQLEEMKILEQKHKEMVEQAKLDKLKEKIAPKDSFISLQHINKIYSNHVQAVYDFNLEINEKEFIVFVGPSGCGKSTTLRMIAGLEDITSGDLYIDGKYANDLEPKNRDVAMVFQSYALYPHMSVYDNLAFGLEVRKIPKAEIEQRINRAAEILQIKQYLDRKPKALSGGQCQRVALGRAIVRNAKVFLMDEPLSNLDAKLRVQMRSEIVNLHNELGATTIYVTHDQTEAMTMASRIVVMKDGYIQQIGTPKEVYDRPSNTFVATFIGSPAMNIIPVQYDNGIINVNDNIKINLSEDEINKCEEFFKLKIENTGDLDIKNKYISYLDNKSFNILLGIRPENISIEGGFSTAKSLTSSSEFEIRNAELLGNEYHLHFSLNDNIVIAKVYSDRIINSKEKLSIVFDRDAIHLFDDISKEFII